MEPLKDEELAWPVPGEGWPVPLAKMPLDRLVRARDWLCRVLCSLPQVSEADRQWLDPIDERTLVVTRAGVGLVRWWAAFGREIARRA